MKISWYRPVSKTNYKPSRGFHGSKNKVQGPSNGLEGPVALWYLALLTSDLILPFFSHTGSLRLPTHASWGPWHLPFFLMSTLSSQFFASLLLDIQSSAEVCSGGCPKAAEDFSYSLWGYPLISEGWWYLMVCFSRGLCFLESTKFSFSSYTLFPPPTSFFPNSFLLELSLSSCAGDSCGCCVVWEQRTWYFSF